MHIQYLAKYKYEIYYQFINIDEFDITYSTTRVVKLHVCIVTLWLSSIRNSPISFFVCQREPQFFQVIFNNGFKNSILYNSNDLFCIDAYYFFYNK